MKMLKWLGIRLVYAIAMIVMLYVSLIMWYYFLKYIDPVVHWLTGSNFWEFIA